MNNVVLIGLGPHAKRIYLHYLASLKIIPRLVIDIESNADNVKKYLYEHAYNTETYFVPDQFRDVSRLPSNIGNEILSKLKQLNISHAIISTEPKAHKAYVRLLLQEGDVRILVDKPLTALCHVSTDPNLAKKIYSDYEDISHLDPDGRVVLQVQRRWHPGYQYIYKLLESTVATHQIPITSLEIFHCDGMWNMPNEFLCRENHSYKYGFGKLFHSGYHFIDLAAWLLKPNNQLKDKRPNNAELYVSAVRPDDFLAMLDNKNYQSLLDTDKFSELFKNKAAQGFNEFGEIDYDAILTMRHDQNIISTVTLNLHQNGFSRRAWSELPEDTYKSNGRVRHERLNISIGPLMNIQVHSYQARQIKEKCDEPQGNVGTTEHFDIYVFRNTKLIGGLPFTKVGINELAPDVGQDFIGYNELARKNCLNSFLFSPNNDSRLDSHSFGMQIVSNSYLSMAQRYCKQSPIINFEILSDKLSGAL